MKTFTPFFVGFAGWFVLAAMVLTTFLKAPVKEAPAAPQPLKVLRVSPPL